MGGCVGAEDHDVAGLSVREHAPMADKRVRVQKSPDGSQQ
jgi:hypothetical protein